MWGRSHPLGFLCLSLVKGRRNLCVSIYLLRARHSCQSLLALRVCRLDMQAQDKIVQIKKIMGHPPLPHELNQRHKTEDFEHLKIAHKLYTLGVVVEYHK